VLTTDRERLLARLEPMTDEGRIRHVIDLGRQSLSEPGLGVLLDELGRGTFYERRLALMACHGSREGARVLRATTDPSQRLRDRAIRLAALLCDNEQALAVLESLPPRRRRRLAARLAHRRRHGVVDRFILRGAASPRALRELLPYASGAVVAGRLDLFDDGSDEEWKRLAGRHPGSAEQALLRRVEREAPPDARLVWLANAATERLARRGPGQALALQRALAATEPLATLALHRLLPEHATEVADLVLASQDDVRLTLGTAIDRLDGPRLAALAFRHPGARRQIVARFRRLSPETRHVVYEAAGSAWLDGDGVLDIEVVRWLSRFPREAEAERHLQLPGLATQPGRRVPYASLLGWDRALRELSAELGSPDPDLRILAIGALVSSIRYQRERAAEAIEFLHRRKHEQDPVRAAFLRALAGLPPGTWRTDDLPGLGQVARDALDASDLSEASAAALTDLAARLLQRHPEWASRALTDIARERGHLAGARDLGSRMSDGHLAYLVPRLLPVLRAWNGRGREQQVINVARSLGRRMRPSEELGELLVEVLLTTRSASVASGCLSVLRQHQPERFAKAAVRLLEQDQSAILLGAVSEYLSLHRQDLLTPFLEPRTYAGRFSSNKARLVLSFSRGFQRWTATQEATFARSLETLTRRDPARDTPAILRALGQIADLHLEPPARLIEMAAAQEPVLRDVALRLLRRVDRADRVVPTLLAALGDDRARIAVYALRSTMLSIPAAEAIGHLARAPFGQVTVAKEVVRLLGDLPVPEALTELVRLAGLDLHRDVRTALLRALWGHLDQPAAWAVLEEAAGSPDPAIIRPLVHIPANRLERDAQRRLVALQARLAAHPDPAVRLDVAARCAVLPVPDLDGALLGALLPLLSSRLPDERTATGAAVCAIARERDAARVAAAVAGLVPDRRALSAAAGALVRALPRARGRLLPVARGVLTELDRDALAAPLALELAARILTWQELGERLERWSAARQLDGDLFASAVRMLDHATAVGQRADHDGLAALERHLAAAEEPRLRRLGLAALVGLVETPGGWSSGRRELLAAYQADPSALVAGPAQFTFPPEEA
jgi:hypothetical protein